MANDNVIEVVIKGIDQLSGPVGQAAESTTASLAKISATADILTKKFDKVLPESIIQKLAQSAVQISQAYGMELPKAIEKTSLYVSELTGDIKGLKEGLSDEGGMTRALAWINAASRAYEEFSKQVVEAKKNAKPDTTATATTPAGVPTGTPLTVIDPKQTLTPINQAVTTTISGFDKVFQAADTLTKKFAGLIPDSVIQKLAQGAAQIAEQYGVKLPVAIERVARVVSGLDSAVKGTNVAISGGAAGIQRATALLDALGIKYDAIAKKAPEAAKAIEKAFVGPPRPTAFGTAIFPGDSNARQPISGINLQPNPLNLGSNATPRPESINFQLFQTTLAKGGSNDAVVAAANRAKKELEDAILLRLKVARQAEIKSLEDFQKILAQAFGSSQKSQVANIAALQAFATASNVPQSAQNKFFANLGPGGNAPPPGFVGPPTPPGFSPGGGGPPNIPPVPPSTVSSFGSLSAAIITLNQGLDLANRLLGPLQAGLNAVSQSAGQFEQSVVGITSTLELFGKTAPAKGLIDFADEMARTANVSKETTLEVERTLATLTALGQGADATGEQLKQATSLILGLAKVEGSSPDTIARQVAQVLRDPGTTNIGRGLKIPVSLSMDERLPFMLKQFGGTFEVLKKQADTFQGSQERLTLSLKSLAVVIGTEMNAPLKAFNNEVSNSILGLADFLKANEAIAKTVGLSAAALSGLAGVVTNLIPLLGSLALIVANWGALAALGGTLLIAIGGIPGLLAILGVAAATAAGSWLYFKNQTQATARALESADIGGKVAAITKEIDELNKRKLELTAKGNIGSEAIKLDAQLASLQKELETAKANAAKANAAKGSTPIASDATRETPQQQHIRDLSASLAAESLKIVDNLAIARRELAAEGAKILFATTGDMQQLLRSFDETASSIRARGEAAVNEKLREASKKIVGGTGTPEQVREFERVDPINAAKIRSDQAKQTEMELSRLRLADSEKYRAEQESLRQSIEGLYSAVLNANKAVIESDKDRLSTLRETSAPLEDQLSSIGRIAAEELALNDIEKKRLDTLLKQAEERINSQRLAGRVSNEALTEAANLRAAQTANERARARIPLTRDREISAAVDDAAKRQSLALQAQSTELSSLIDSESKRLEIIELQARAEWRIRAPLEQVLAITRNIDELEMSILKTKLAQAKVDAEKARLDNENKQISDEALKAAQANVVAAERAITSFIPGGIKALAEFDRQAKASAEQLAGSLAENIVSGLEEGLKGGKGGIKKFLDDLLISTGRQLLVKGLQESLKTLIEPETLKIIKSGQEPPKSGADWIFAVIKNAISPAAKPVVSKRDEEVQTAAANARTAQTQAVENVNKATAAARAQEAAAKELQSGSRELSIGAKALFDAANTISGSFGQVPSPLARQPVETNTPGQDRYGTPAVITSGNIPVQTSSSQIWSEQNNQSWMGPQNLGEIASTSKIPIVASGTNQVVPFENLIQEAAKKFALDPNLLKAIIKVESDFLPAAISKAGAVGLTQLTPAAAQDVGVTDRTDPRQSIFGGAEYFKRQLRQFGGDEEKALQAYNWGATNLRDYLLPQATPKQGNLKPKMMPDETRAYPQKVLAARDKFAGTTQGEPDLSHTAGPIEGFPGATQEEIAATLQGVTVKTDASITEITSTAANILTASTQNDIAKAPEIRPNENQDRVSILEQRKQELLKQQGLGQQDFPILDQDLANKIKSARADQVTQIDAQIKALADENRIADKLGVSSIQSRPTGPIEATAEESAIALANQRATNTVTQEVMVKGPVTIAQVDKTIETNTKVTDVAPAAAESLLAASAQPDIAKTPEVAPVSQIESNVQEDWLFQLKEVSTNTAATKETLQTISESAVQQASAVRPVAIQSSSAVIPVFVTNIAELASASASSSNVKLGPTTNASEGAEKIADAIKTSSSVQGGSNTEFNKATGVGMAQPSAPATPDFNFNQISGIFGQIGGLFGGTQAGGVLGKAGSGLGLIGNLINSFAKVDFGNIFKGIGDFFGFGGAAGAAASSVGAVADATGVLDAFGFIGLHTGGLIDEKLKSFHTGGNVGEEVTIKALRGEYVLQPSAVSSIGKSKLDDINATGKLPKFHTGGMIEDMSELAAMLPAYHVGGKVGDQPSVKALRGDSIPQSQESPLSGVNASNPLPIFHTGGIIGNVSERLAMIPAYHEGGEVGHSHGGMTSVPEAASATVSNDYAGMSIDSGVMAKLSAKSSGPEDDTGKGKHTGKNMPGGGGIGGQEKPPAPIHQNIFIVDKRPGQLSANDVVAIIENDMVAKNGKTAKGIQHVIQRNR